MGMGLESEKSLTVTDRLELPESAHVNLAPLFTEIVGFVLPPPCTQHFLLCFTQVHFSHVLFHSDPSLFPRGSVAKKRKVQVLEIDSGRNGLVKSGKRWGNLPVARTFWNDVLIHVWIVLLILGMRVK